VFHTLPDFAGGLVGERDGENFLRKHPLVLNELSDPVSQDACFAGAWTGHNQHRPIGGKNSLLLLLIEPVQEIGNGV
jgi:hypothetical protein